MAPEYRDIYSNGTYTVSYFNGTIALYDPAGKFLGYMRKPQFFIGEVNRTDFVDGSFALQYFNNKTVRYFPVPPSESASKREKALAPLFIDKFANGTVRKVFVNGTIAVYHNGIFIKYEIKPREMYREEEFPVEEKEDGSKTVFYPNGTVRVYEPEYSEAKFKDCVNEQSCTIYYKNGSIGQQEGDSFYWI